MKPGEYHLGAIIAVGNDQGEILCTLRSPEKKFCPGIWENTGGGALAGETSRAAAQRELQEETGIFAELEEFIFLYRVQSTEPDGTGLFNDVYGLRRNIDVKDIVLQPGETIDVKWLPYKEWEALGRAERILTPAGPKNEEFFRILRSFIQPK